MASSMRITFLGTGTSQGVPVIACHCAICRSTDFRDNRTRTSVHIAVNGLSLVIDTGTDFRTQMLRERVQSLDAVLFTHAHKDHTSGLDDIRPFYFQRKSDMPIYATEAVIAQIKQEFSYIFAEKKSPGVPGVEVNLIGKERSFWVENTEIIPIEVMHYRLPVLGFRVGDFTYITDANAISPVELDKVRGSKILVVNALRRAKHLSHFNLEEALQLAEEIGAEQTYLTHISHELGRHREVSKELPKGVFLAYDGLVVSL